jgi:hypothetical protein
MESLFKKRVVLITGKGGVGRSCVTAALAQSAARRGLRVLVSELGDDPEDYSPLARHFGRDRLPKADDELAAGIRGVVLLARSGQEMFLRESLHSATLARAALSSDALARLLSAGPSFREMGIFFQLLNYLRLAREDGTPEHQLILVDMPATGHTLSLTGLPDLLLRLVPKGPVAVALREGQSYLNDPEKAAALIVTLPETLPVSESLELLAGLGQTAMPTEAIVLNRVPLDPFSPAERAALEPLLQTDELLGTESFRKPTLAHRETARLRAGTRVPIFAIPELDQQGLIEAIARQIDRMDAAFSKEAGAVRK